MFKRIVRAVEGVTARGLNSTEWGLLNKTEVTSVREARQLKLIDVLRIKYKHNPKVLHDLDIFDPRTGEADRQVAMMNERLLKK